MARVKGAVHAKKHHRAVLEQAQGYYGNKSRSFRAANEQLMHSKQYAFRDRRARKGDFRQLWIQRINAAARLNGTSYSRFIAGLHRAEVDVDRKVLADLAVSEPDAFASLVRVANDALAEPATEGRGALLTQAGLAFTHQRVRRVRQLLSQARASGGRSARWCWRVPSCSVAALEAEVPVESAYVAPGGRDDPAVSRVLEEVYVRGGRVFDLAPGVIERVADTVTPQPLVSMVSFAPARARVGRGGAPDLMVCVDVRDPGNLGTMIRTAESAGVGGVVCCEGTVDPTNPKCLRASAGSVFRVPVVAAAGPDQVLGRLGECGLPGSAPSREGGPTTRSSTGGAGSPSSSATNPPASMSGGATARRVGLDPDGRSGGLAQRERVRRGPLLRIFCGGVGFRRVGPRALRCPPWTPPKTTACVREGSGHDRGDGRRRPGRRGARSGPGRRHLDRGDAHGRRIGRGKEVAAVGGLPDPRWTRRRRAPLARRAIARGPYCDRRARRARGARRSASRSSPGRWPRQGRT